MSVPLDRLFLGDARDILPALPDESIDLIVTSPPYGDNRKQTYQGVSIGEYVDWFLPISAELKRVLKPEGSFILNIKERAVDGERQTYVIELVLALKRQGWLWTEEYIWHKKNAYPGKWPNRFRDAWERCLHFTKSRKFKMHQHRVRVPMGEWTKERLTRLNGNDFIRRESTTGSGMGKNMSNWLGRELVAPTNVLHLPTVTSDCGHSAAFPRALPVWFIKLLSNKGDVILDPFAGSGTTLLAAIAQERHFVGVELMPHYYQLSRKNIAEAMPASSVERMRLGARRTHKKRVNRTARRIQRAIERFQCRGQRVSKAAVARSVGVSREHLSRRYQHLFDAES